jgi:hypothetical protein
MLKKHIYALNQPVSPTDYIHYSCPQYGLSAYNSLKATKKSDQGLCQIIIMPYRYLCTRNYATNSNNT